MMQRILTIKVAGKTGSGKTMTIELIEQMLRKDGNYKILINIEHTPNEDSMMIEYIGK